MVDGVGKESLGVGNEEFEGENFKGIEQVSSWSIVMGFGYCADCPSLDFT